MNPLLDKNIFVDLYDGSYGPTILLNIPTEELHRNFLGLILRLSEHESLSIQLKDCDRVTFGNIDSFILQNGVFTSKVSLKKSERGLNVEWAKPASAWRKTKNLIETLRPCSHEYLSDGESDEVLIMLAFKEGLTI